VPKCLGAELSGHFGTSAEPDTSAPVPKCLLDTSAIVPKCLGTEVSWVRSVRLPLKMTKPNYKPIVVIRGSGLTIIELELELTLALTLSNPNTKQTLILIYVHNFHPNPFQNPQVRTSAHLHFTSGLYTVSHKRIPPNHQR